MDGPTDTTMQDYRTQCHQKVHDRTAQRVGYREDRKFAIVGEMKKKDYEATRVSATWLGTDRYDRALFVPFSDCPSTKKQIHNLADGQPAAQYSRALFDDIGSGNPAPWRRSARPLASSRLGTRSPHSIFGLLGRQRLTVDAGGVNRLYLRDLTPVPGPGATENNQQDTCVAVPDPTRPDSSANSIRFCVEEAQS